MNILLVAINAKYIHSNPAVYSLKACTGMYSSHVQIAEFTINQAPAFILQEIYQKKPDVIAFSCYIWNRILIGQLIGDLHKILPDTELWAGGPEVSYDPYEVKKEWGLKGVMAGAGEGSFSFLVAAYVKGTADSLPDVLTTANTPRLPFEDIPFWYRDMELSGNRIIYYESSRGCPFSCSYCLSSIDKQMEFRPMKRVCEELSFFLEQKVPQVKFIDRTFNCNKNHALPILRYLLEHDNGITNFHFEIEPCLLDEDYFSLLKQMRPGAVQLEIGIQSTNQQTIAEIDRNMDFAKAAGAVRRILSWNNIHVHLDLIAGLPYEDFPSFQASFNDVYALQPMQLQLGFLKVLKGSAMAARAQKYRLVSSSQPPYEVLSTQWLSYEELCRLKQAEEVFEIYYNSGQFAHTLRLLLSYFDTPYAMYDGIAAWFAKHHLFGILSSRTRKYEILLEFGASRITSSLPAEAGASAARQLLALRETLTFDLYLREHMKNRPSFAATNGRWKQAVSEILRAEANTHALFPEYSGLSYRELTKALHVEVFETLYEKPAAVIFSYHKRDPLTNNGMAVRATLPL
ncbi:MAG: B12-binding domain-containing radical SAM protein [Eubacterium sp.]|nr:B12-binding domain-containing radical SAM protein [Eubacterium sp.]